MSLYHEAASVLTEPDGGGSLKSRIYNNKTLKSSPAHLYALVSETIKWSDVLREVVERSQLLSVEKKVRNVSLCSDFMNDANLGYAVIVVDAYFSSTPSS
jgi:putative methyltransferase